MSRAAATGSLATGSRIIRPDAHVIYGDCVHVMEAMESASVDFVLTDPPYLLKFRLRDGRISAKDRSPAWIKPAFAEIYRVLKPDTFCVSFYGWNAADLFISAWKSAGFRIAGHLVFPKPYASSSRYVGHCHEQAYLLVKGKPGTPARLLRDVRSWAYTGNRLHPTQKPACILRPLIRAFCPADGTVLDPFCGSGSTLVAARQTGRKSIGIELDRSYFGIARRRLC